MKIKFHRLLIGLTLLAALNQSLSSVRAQTYSQNSIVGTAFTYQGLLQNDGSPANGLYDFRFNIIDAPSGGTILAPTIITNAIAVSNGLFAVTMDFGQGIFIGPARWLEITVSSNNANSFFTLSPRQLITPTPYAIFANSAINLSGTVPATQVSGTLPLAQLPAGVVTNGGSGTSLTGVAELAGGNILTGNQTITSGNVGIGTVTPASALEVANGDVKIDSHDLFLTANSTTNNGYGIGYRTGLPGISPDGPFLYGYNGGALGGLNPTTIALSWDFLGNIWVNNNLSTATLNVRNGATFAGNVGIGTTTPSSPLHVQSAANAPLLQLTQTGASSWCGFNLANASGSKWEMDAQNGTTPGLVFYAGSKFAFGSDWFGTLTVSSNEVVNGTLSIGGHLRFPGAGADTSTPVFTHKATAANVSGNKTYINNPVCNGQPNAILILTENWQASDNVGNSKVVGVYYDAGAGQWTIFVDDGTAMPVGAAYNVMVTLP